MSQELRWHFGLVSPFRGIKPTIGAKVFLAPGSVVMGDTVLGDQVSFWYNAVSRADVHFIHIGMGTNIQDNAVLHVTHDTNPLIIGTGVTVGHGARLHGCTVADHVLVGISATVLDGAEVEEEVVIAAGALVPPGMKIPRGSMVAGVPAKVIRSVRDSELEMIYGGIERYKGYAMEHVQQLNDVETED